MTQLTSNLVTGQMLPGSNATFFKLSDLWSSPGPSMTHSKLQTAPGGVRQLFSSMKPQLRFAHGDQMSAATSYSFLSCCWLGHNYQKVALGFTGVFSSCLFLVSMRTCIRNEKSVYLGCGGIGGLATALSAGTRRLPVTVLEQAAAFSEKSGLTFSLAGIFTCLTHWV
jgi:hypothetical protein